MSHRRTPFEEIPQQRSDLHLLCGARVVQTRAVPLNRCGSLCDRRVVFFSRMSQRTLICSDSHRGNANLTCSCPSNYIVVVARGALACQEIGGQQVDVLVVACVACAPVLIIAVVCIWRCCTRDSSRTRTFCLNMSILVVLKYSRWKRADGRKRCQETMNI